MRNFSKRIYTTLVVLLMCVFITGCNAAACQSMELSRQADNFEKTRIISVINTRTGEIIFRLTGTFSCQYSSGDLDIISAVGPDEYEKHFIHMNENLTYIVEDTASNGDLYYQKVEYFPERELVVETS